MYSPTLLAVSALLATAVASPLLQRNVCTGLFDECHYPSLRFEDGPGMFLEIVCDPYDGEGAATLDILIDAYVQNKNGDLIMKERNEYAETPPSPFSF